MNRFLYRAFILIVLNIVFFSNNTYADQTIFTAQVNKKELKEDENFTLKVILETEIIQNIRVKQPNLTKDFYILSQIKYQNTLSTPQGKTKLKIVYLFVLRPKRSGKITIHPFMAEVGKSQIKTSPIDIKVLPRHLTPWDKFISSGKSQTI